MSLDRCNRISERSLNKNPVSLFMSSVAMVDQARTKLVLGQPSWAANTGSVKYLNESNALVSKCVWSTQNIQGHFGPLVTFRTAEDASMNKNEPG